MASSHYSDIATAKAAILRDIAKCGLGEEGFKYGQDDLPADKGAYLLALYLDVDTKLDLPKLSQNKIGSGWYLYAGSAWGPGGLRARVKRHLRPNKPKHWHIDQLTAKPRYMAALIFPQRQECGLVGALMASQYFGAGLAGFGSSDCKICPSHLLFWQGAIAGS